MKALWFEDSGNARIFIGRDRRRQDKKNEYIGGTAQVDQFGDKVREGRVR